ETTDISGASLRWTVDPHSGLCAYRNLSLITSINAQEFKYFGKMTHSKIWDNGDLVILTVRCLCIFYLSDDDTIELSYYWDNGMRPSSIVNYLLDLTEISLDELMDDVWSKLLYAVLNDADKPLPPPSFKSIWWHKRKAVESNDGPRIQLFENLINLLITRDNLAKYGNIMFAEAIKHREKAVVESIMETCIDLFRNDPFGCFGFLQIVADSLSELRAHYPDRAANYISTISFVVAPHCDSVNALTLSFDRICTFANKPGNPSRFIKRSQFHNIMKVYINARQRFFKSLWRLVRSSILTSAGHKTILTSAWLLLMKHSVLTTIISVVDFMESFGYSRKRLFKRRSTLSFVVRLPNFCSYPRQYSAA